MVTVDDGQEKSGGLRGLLREFAARLNGVERTEAASIMAELRGLVDLDERDEIASGIWARPPEPRALKEFFGDLPQTNFYGAPGFYYPIERIMPRHADIASRTFPSLDDFIAARRGISQALDVCIVTFDIEGPTQGGGLAAEYRRLAELLRDAGHKVTVLYMRGRNCANGSIDEWVARYADIGITLVPLRPAEMPPASGIVGSATARPIAAYEWLKGKPFDVIHATGAMGCVYPALSAKRLGLAFAETLFVVEAWPPTMWNLFADAAPIPSLRTLAVSYMERKCVELADLVVSPSHHMLRWMMRHGYDLPKERCFVQPVLLAGPAPAASGETRKVRPIAELAFIGSFDARKGIGALSRALDLVKDELRDVKVTFFAEPSAAFSMKESLRRLSAHWPFRVEFVEIASAAEAIARLRGKDCLAVMPLLVDSLPSVLSECLANGIPVLVSSSGAAQEMICEEDRAAVVCDYTPSLLAERIRSVLREGAVVARPSVRPDRICEVWTQAHRVFADRTMRQSLGGQDAHRTWNGVAPTVGAGDGRPLVSVCIAHFNRPKQLAQAVESIRRQSYKAIEIVIVDDGSSLPEAKDYLARLELELASEGRGRIVRQQNRYLGAARNTGVRSSRGEFVLVMDDDDLAKPHEVETFVRAAEFSGADILCCYADTFAGPGMPDEGRQYHDRVSGLGDAVSLGLFVNCFGGSRAFIRRRVFEALGGFTEDYGVGLDDHEFAMRAVLRGVKLMVIPEALYWYRLSPVRLRDMHYDRLSGEMRVFNAVLDNLPLCSYEALRFAQGFGRTSFRAAGRPSWSPQVIRDAITIWTSGQFDGDYYRRANPDVAASGANPLLHFVRFGVYEGRKPNPGFDPEAYADDFPEVAAKGLNPLVHFIRSGAGK